jgi:hypothetical protein
MLRLWVAERDACLHCLAYQGRVAPVEGSFPRGLTFADKPLKNPRLAGPPLHPNCRCDVQPIHEDDVNSDLTEGLLREARRSVVKGWSLPSESNASRLRAADRLLQAGARLPKSVEQEARRAVRQGKFRSRTVPTG